MHPTTLALLATSIIALLAGSASAQDNPADALRMSICLNGTWEMAAMADAASIPADGWKPVRIPAVPLCEDNRPAGLWYRKALDVPAEWRREDRRFFLELEKVGHYAAIWCNGQKVGEHHDQFTPFEVELTGQLKPGGNEIAVLVHDASGAFARPGEPLKDDAGGHAYRPAGQSPTRRNWVGIVGDITFSWRPAQSIADVVVVTSFRKKSIEVELAQATAEPPASAPARATYACRATVLDGHKPVLELPQTKVGDGAPARLAAPWADFVPWNPPGMGQPRLYWLRAELLKDGQVVDRTFTRFGFREVWIDGNRLLLNGQRLFLVGTYHAWLDPLRYNNDRHPIAMDIKAMQSAGINCLHGHWDDLGRTALEVCDEMGMLVLNAFYCDGQLAIKPDADEGWPAWATRTTRSWARATRGHPSIVAWRPFCATPKNLDKVADLAAWRKQVAEAVRGEHPTALMADGSDIATHSQGAVDNQGKPDDGSRMAARARQSPRPLLTNEIWASFRPFEAHAQFLTDFYQKAWDSGSAGFVVQHLPYCKVDQPFQARWLSDSGPGNRSTDGSIKRWVNWSDASRPAWTEDPYAALTREQTAKVTGQAPKPFAGTTTGDLLVSGAAAGKPVFLLPADPAAAPAIGVLAAGDGTAWLIVKQPGSHRLVHGDRRQLIDIAAQDPAPSPGFVQVQRVDLANAPPAK